MNWEDERARMMANQKHLYRPPADLTTSAPYNPNAETQEGQAVSAPPVESPTGVAVIPPRAVPYVLAGAGVLYVVGEAWSDPSPWTPDKVVSVVLKCVAVLTGGALPGWRKR